MDVLGLDVNEVDPDQLDSDPQGVEQSEVPVVREILPGNWVGLAVHSALVTRPAIADEETPRTCPLQGWLVL